MPVNLCFESPSFNLPPSSRPQLNPQSAPNGDPPPSLSFCERGRTRPRHTDTREHTRVQIHTDDCRSPDVFNQQRGPRPGGPSGYVSVNSGGEGRVTSADGPISVG